MLQLADQDRDGVVDRGGWMLHTTNQRMQKVASLGLRTYKQHTCPLLHLLRGAHDPRSTRGGCPQ
jgi:hypothetical protein